MDSYPSYSSKTLTGIVTVSVVCTLIAFLCEAFPMYVIRPFRAQAARELAMALLVLRHARWVSTAAAVLVVAAAWLVWQRTVWKRSLGSKIARVFCILMGILACVFSALTRVNPFENLMFHSAGKPQFTDVAAAKVDPDDMVLTVQVNQDARAYPIRTMGYHHIVNDWVSGVPIAATY